MLCIFTALKLIYSFSAISDGPGGLEHPDVDHSASSRHLLSGRGYSVREYDVEGYPYRIGSHCNFLPLESGSGEGVSSNFEEAASHVLTGSDYDSLRSGFADSGAQAQLAQQAEVPDVLAWRIEIHAVNRSTKYTPRFTISVTRQHQGPASTGYESSRWLGFEFPSEDDHPSTPEALAALFSKQNVEFKYFMSQLKTEQAKKCFIDALYNRVYDRWRKWINDYTAWTLEARVAASKKLSERRKGRKTLMGTANAKSFILPSDSCFSHITDAGMASAIGSTLRRSV
jgi:hypothetical protein